MLTQRELGEPAFVLHTRAYRESSLLVEMFTRNHGRVALVAKGVRKPKPRFEIAPFRLCQIAWVGKSQLKTLTACESIDIQGVQGKALFSAMYLNEILLRVLHPYDPHIDLFEGYQSAISDIARTDVNILESCLREFEKLLLKECGYELRFDWDVQNDSKIDPEAYYRFLSNEGFSRYEVPAEPENATTEVYPGKQLLAIADSDYSQHESLRTAKKVMRAALQPHIGDKPLASRALFVKKN